jgi:hypothetical protein
MHLRVDSLVVKDFIPTQLTVHGNRALQPWFFLTSTELEEGSEVLVCGRIMFWAFMDALFPTDPFVRTHTMDVIKYEPEVFIADIPHIVKESETEYISVMVGQGVDEGILNPASHKKGLYDGPVATSIVVSSGMVAPDLQQIQDVIQTKCLLDSHLAPFHWRDRRGATQLPCLRVRVEKDIEILIIDIGKKVVITASKFLQDRKLNQNDLVVRAAAPSVIKKGAGYLHILCDYVNYQLESISSVSSSLVFPPGTLPKQIYDVNKNGGGRTMELFDLEYDLHKLGVLMD